MRNRPFHINRKRGIARLDQFCNGPLQNWLLNTHPPFWEVDSKDCSDLGGSNPLLQILEEILVAFEVSRERTVHESIGSILAFPAVHVPDLKSAASLLALDHWANNRRIC